MSCCFRRSPVSPRPSPSCSPERASVPVSELPSRWMSAAAAADAAPIADPGAAAAVAAPPVAEATLPSGEGALEEFMFSLVMPTVSVKLHTR